MIDLSVPGKRDKLKNLKIRVWSKNVLPQLISADLATRNREETRLLPQLSTDDLKSNIYSSKKCKIAESP